MGGLDTTLGGTVRVAGPPLLTGHMLAPCAIALHIRHPGIGLELISAYPDPDLAAREADICVRLRRFDRNGLVARRIGTLAFGLYASRDYLGHNGEPDTARGCPGHRLIATLDEDEIPRPSGLARRHSRLRAGPAQGR